MFHPGSHRQTHFALEGIVKGVIITEAALLSQLLGGERATGINGLALEDDEVVDAQIVDIGIVSRALIGKILAEIETVGSNSFSKL